MHVLVTGGAGFIGSHVVDTLLGEGADVTVVDDLSHGTRHNVAPGAQFIQGDVLDPDAWRGQVTVPDVVMHLAGQISVPVSEQNPVEDVRINVLGTVAMLKASREWGTREFRFASSAAVYGDDRRVPLAEEYAGRPLSYYGLNKWMAESYVAHEDRLGRVTGIVLRLANVYGPRQRTQGEGGVVAVFSDAIARGQNPVIDGDGGQTRDFIAVHDVARAFCHRLGDSPGGIYNVGTQQAVRILDVWDVLAQTAGISPDQITHGPPRPGDIRHSRLDVSRSRAWGYEARVPLKQGIQDTYDWFSKQAFR